MFILYCNKEWTAKLLYKKCKLSSQNQELLEENSALKTLVAEL